MSKIIGIDLGTTNSAVAYVDTSAERWRVSDFAIPQLVAAGEVEARAVLPSFHYEPAAGEFAPGAMGLPWGACSSPSDGAGLVSTSAWTWVAVAAWRGRPTWKA